MAKFQNCVSLVASALCLLSLIGMSKAAHFTVEGKIYCDSCRTQFITRVSKYLEGATVRLECKSRENGTLSYSAEGVSLADGTYKIEVDGDHEEDLCEVALASSPDPECSEINKDNFLRKASVVALTTNNGMSTGVRSANPLGFMKKKALPECVEVLKELGITPSGLV